MELLVRVHNTLRIKYIFRVLIRVIRPGSLLYLEEETISDNFSFANAKPWSSLYHLPMKLMNWSLLRNHCFYWHQILGYPVWKTSYIDLEITNISLEKPKADWKKCLLCTFDFKKHNLESWISIENWPFRNILDKNKGWAALKPS